MQRLTRTTLGVLAVALTTGIVGCGSLGSATPSAARARQHAAATSSAAAGGASGTGQGAGTPAERLARVPAVARRVTCAAAEPANEGVPLALLPGGQDIPAGFSPVAVVECINLGQFGPGHGAGAAERREAAVSGLAGLMTALRQTQAEPSPPGPVCIAQLRVPWFVLVGQDGQVIRPRLPATLCGQSTASRVLASLKALPWINLGVAVAPPIVNREQPGAQQGPADPGPAQ